jgi:glucan phosphoethanolaminetransferase (alkaline phosphatase superfamily)
MVDMADAPLWVLILLFIPYADALVYIWLWMRISENTNKSPWLGLLMIVPLVNIAAALYMAFYEPKQIRT